MIYRKAAKKGLRGMTVVFINYKFMAKHFEEKYLIKGDV